MSKVLVINLKEKVTCYLIHYVAYFGLENIHFIRNVYAGKRKKGRRRLSVKKVY